MSHATLGVFETVTDRTESDNALVFDRRRCRSFWEQGSVLVLHRYRLTKENGNSGALGRLWITDVAIGLTLGGR